MASKTVAILGGGVGGIVAANDLRRKLSAEHRVVLVERNAEHAFAPSFLWLMKGDRRPEDIRRPLVEGAARLRDVLTRFSGGRVAVVSPARSRIQRNRRP